MMRAPLTHLFRPVMPLMFAGVAPFVAGQGAKPEVIATVDGDPIVRLLPPDAIAALENPAKLTAVAALREGKIRRNEMVIGVEIGGEACAYSIWALDHHEVVNDQLGGLPIAVTW